MTDHSYFDSVYLKIFTALSQQTEDFCILPMYCRLEDFFYVVKKSSDLQHIVWPGTVPNLGMADREFELWTGSEIGSSGLEFGLETGPVTGLAELAYYPSLGLDPNWV